jgi:hypothetical protein
MLIDTCRLPLAIIFNRSTATIMGMTSVSTLAAIALALILSPTAYGAIEDKRHLQSSIDLETCTNVDSDYKIEVIDMGTGITDPRYVEAFQDAATRWSKVVVGDVPDVAAGITSDLFSGQFSQPYNGAVDDLVIGYEIANTIDGPGGTLGSAGPVFVRRDRFGRPLTTISGVMRFDGQDLDRMPIGDVKAIVLHEMGHCLGLVGTTGRCNNACDSTNRNARSAYTCPLATAEYGLWAPGSLLLENSGGMGTACGHWEEDLFRTQQSSEVMTGFFEANLFQPLSAVTVAGLEDLGYEVDYCGADVWPADSETIQRFEVYKTNQTMDVDSMMERIPPAFGIDDEGETTPWEDMTSAAPSWTVGRAASFLMLTVGVASLL